MKNQRYLLEKHPEFNVVSYWKNNMKKKKIGEGISFEWLYYRVSSTASKDTTIY